MEYSDNYKALLVLRKALELHIAVSPFSGQYGCSSLYRASVELDYEGMPYSIAAEVNRIAFDEYMLQDHAVYWRNCFDEEDEPAFAPTAELRQYRIANFYRAIDLQEKLVAAEVLEKALKYYIEVQVPKRLNEHLVTPAEVGFCTSIHHALPGAAYCELVGLALKYWQSVQKSSPHPNGFFWFNTVQERIDAVTTLIYKLKGK